MGLLDLATAPVRAVLGGVRQAESEAVQHSPLAGTRELEAKLADAVHAAHRAAESVERHVEGMNALVESLGPLSDSVTRLTDQIGELLRVTAPLAAMERDVSRLEHLFGRRRRGGQDAASVTDDSSS